MMKTTRSQNCEQQKTEGSRKAHTYCGTGNRYKMKRVERRCPVRRDFHVHYIQ